MLSVHVLIGGEEFRTFVQETEMELLRLFKTIDIDHNGKLSRDELQLVSHSELSSPRCPPQQGPSGLVGSSGTPPTQRIVGKCSCSD